MFCFNAGPDIQAKPSQPHSQFDCIINYVSDSFSYLQKCTWVATIVEIYIFRSVPSSTCNTMHTNPSLSLLSEISGD